MDALQKDIVASQLNQYNATINAAENAIEVLGQQVSSAGASPNFIATGTYSWSDLSASVSSLANPALTNLECETVLANFNASTLTSKFVNSVSLLLPISPQAITMIANLTCGPVIPGQTLDDQPAYYTAEFNISAHYIYFASDASYVTYASVVDHSLQFLEDSAPLNEQNVKDAVNRALHALAMNAVEVEIC